MSKSSNRQSTIELRIKNLEKRVAALERPLRTTRQIQASKKLWADFERRSAERSARSEAMREYRDKEREQRYRDNPDALRLAVELEDQENKFLKSRGLEPNPTLIPPALRRKAKALSNALNKKP